MNQLSSGRNTRLLPLLLLICMMTVFNYTNSTHAYFTDNVSAQNVIVSGNISIFQHEQERYTADGGSVQLKRFTQYQNLAPLVQAGEPQTETISVSGHSVSLRGPSARNYVDKIVTVENVGVNPAYVRTFIAVPTGGCESDSPAGLNWLHWDATHGDDAWSWGTKQIAADGTVSAENWPAENWNMINDASIGGVEYDIYVATHSKVVQPGETTAPSLLGFWVDSSLSNDNSGRYYLSAGGNKTHLDLTGMEILVATQAAQTTTFSDPWTALDTVFGAPNQDNHPWKNSNTVYVSSDIELNTLLANLNGTHMTVRLMDGTYTLPEVLPAGTRIVGHGQNVVITARNISGTAVEFYNVTFKDAVSFSGNGEFDGVTFQGDFSAVFNNPAYLTDCTFEQKVVWNVTENAVRSTIIFRNCTGV